MLTPAPKRDAPLPGEINIKARQKHQSPELRNSKLQSVFPSLREVKLDILINRKKWKTRTQDIILRENTEPPQNVVFL